MKKYIVEISKCEVFMRYEFSCYKCENYFSNCSCFKNTKKYHNVHKIKDDIVNKLFINAV